MTDQIKAIIEAIIEAIKKFSFDKLKNQSKIIVLALTIIGLLFFFFSAAFN